MNLANYCKTLLFGISHYWHQWKKNLQAIVDPIQPPMRAEMLSADQMEQQGQALAAGHVLGKLTKSKRLLLRLDANEEVLLTTRRLLTDVVKSKHRLTPAGEWLLDNFYLIEEQIRIARQHLPVGYMRELPHLAKGDSTGLPRVYDVAMAVISHGDGRVDAQILARFVAAYQITTPMTLGELWAIPIMLRLALIENLRRVAARIAAARFYLQQAQDWANLMIEMAQSDPKSLILVIADMARSEPPMVSAFVAELTRLLQGHGSALALPLTWIEQRLAESSQTIEQMVLSENQQQAADQVSIANSIGSLRFLGATDWRVFVENLSAVEQILRQDLGGIYPVMDFASRDSYRRVIDRLAKHSALSEVEIAKLAMGLADAAGRGETSHSNTDASASPLQTAHVGYYLIDRGLPQLELAALARLPWQQCVRRWAAKWPLTLHVGGIILMSLAGAGFLVEHAYQWGITGWPLLVLALVALISASQLASALANWLAIICVSPILLPRMDYRYGVPPMLRTLVVIPTLLTRKDAIEQLLESLEVRFLGNRDSALHFALLTDFADATSEVLAADDDLLLQAQLGIERLNAKYPEAQLPNTRFFLLHRPRRWNAVAQLWMGRERKRGKLADLNALLRAEGEDLTVAQEQFSLVCGDLNALGRVQYIITLDTDTQLPRDAAREFIAAMAHPLNRPRFDPSGQLVVGGYGILQPRMAASLSGANRSRYAQLFGGEPGIDPYTRSVSDVYQDLFGEGSFIGKGIYDIDVFEQCLNGRLPENRILSHDLLEGCYARSGLLSDVHLYEEYPADYAADVARRERWMRGDWQIASWVLPWVPAPQGKSVVNPLSSLSRWKIMDNLVRSLIPPALLLLLLLGWALGGQVWFWTLTVTGIILVPSLLFALVDAMRIPEEIPLSQHLYAVLHATGRNLAQAVFRIACLPQEAGFSLLAILSSTWRVLFNPRFLLEWRSVSHAGCQGSHHPAAQPSGKAQLSGKAQFSGQAQPSGTAQPSGKALLQLWPSPAVAVLAAVGLGFLNPLGLASAAPVLVLWVIAPWLVLWVSRPPVSKVESFSAPEQLFLRKIARKTWGFFTTTVTLEDNWLPPDNLQLEPGPITAHRTSPTNMGLAVLANLAAYDFGYASVGDFIQRTQASLDTMARLERHQGHFYNWYDTRNLQPLPPRYVSTVDSGNLGGHLLTLRAGALALADQPIISSRVFEGLMDCLLIWLDSLPNQGRSDLDPLLLLFKAACAKPLSALGEIQKALAAQLKAAQDLALNLPDGGDGDCAYWGQALLAQIQDALEECVFLAPWLIQGPAANQNQTGGPFNGIPSLRQLAQCEAELAGLSASIDPTTLVEATPLAGPNGNEDLVQLRQGLSLGQQRAQQRLKEIQHLAECCTQLADMSYDFLYDRTRHQLAIGYNVDDFRRDTSYYDLLASEARLCNFVAIAEGQLPQESWFALGRLRTTAGGDPILLSWSGSMFEYLMPMLVMPSYQGSLLEQTCRAAVASQIAYGNQRGLPWGISESGYNMLDASLNYQYRAFGVPELGLKRGLADDKVIAPYATALALMVAPRAACSNLQRLAGLGLEGRYGFYEAIDYTPARLLRGQTSWRIESYMVHHQGMSLLALAFALLDKPMQRRFEADPALQATLLLLQERIPKRAIIHARSTEDAEGGAVFDTAEGTVHTALGADTAVPEVQLLSNGRYQVMVTNAGGGYSRWKDFAMTRWREDTSCDNWGSFIYLRDLTSRHVWSNTHQPSLTRADSYAAMFSEGRAEFRRRDNEIETYTEIIVSPEDDIELRRLKITNRSSRPRRIEITSYAEVVLAQQAADVTQAAFGKLFVQTQIIPQYQALLCTRRPRSAQEQSPAMFHLLAGQGSELQDISYETDRLAFIGRGKTLAAPQALGDTRQLGGSQGSVLDPIVAIRCHIELAAGESAVLDFVTGAAEHRAGCMALIEKYHDRHLANRALEVAASHSGITLRQINASETDALLYCRLARLVIYSSALLRAAPNLLMQNRRGQSGLWGYAISGDLPIVLLKIADSEHIELARQLIQCHAYWRLKGLAVDLVIWNEDHAGYRQRLQDQIMGLIATGTEANNIDRPGGIFVRSAEQISSEDRILLQSVAKVILADGQGSLAEQLNRRALTDARVPRLLPSRSYYPDRNLTRLVTPGLQLANPLGGFSADGREYVIATQGEQLTPLPWANVLANPQFGSVISESGLAYTWSENAHEYRLTPWSDDSVGASSGEALYLRDEETGHFWSPTPLPCRGLAPYTSRHGFGYSVFEHTEGGITSSLCVYVDLVDAVKYSVLTIRNQSGRTRRLSATGYVEWVLGDLRGKTAMHITTQIDPRSGALFARNAYNTEFSGRVAFLDVDELSRTLTGDRREFLGRHGSIANPQAMGRVQLSGKLGAALDPCGAIQVPFELEDGQSRELIFRLGAGRDIEQAQALALRLRTQGSARAALRKVQDYWQHTLGAVQIHTPDPGINLLANGWLVYQTLACRLWARSGYYQSGGAFGFRDQLQDAMALVHAQPQLLREHLLRCAQHQYPEGDVQHWWHPPNDRGVRTRCSDDYLWLPAATCRYVKATGDRAILDESIHFIEGRDLNADEESYYDLPSQAPQTASLYQHCQRALAHGLRLGVRGLPLMGSGDWNDGMNLVGIHGKGESVWLGFFLYDVLLQFAALAEDYKDPSFAQHCRENAKTLQQNLEQHAWDGAWYKRAWFDDGAALGTASNSECRIDSIAQSWSVLSQAATPERAQTAMDSLNKHLIDRSAGLVKLLDPPFDVGELNPGYIKGYVPGVRENGGQYTHAAVWTIMAFAALGDAERAWELLGLINPLNHTQTAQGLATYKAEPYVLAADVYGVAPHLGRGGWTWYTGSAGLCYRLILESLLGINRKGDQLHIHPCIPRAWQTYAIDYCFGSTLYKIVVTQSVDESRPKVTQTITLKLDGETQTAGYVVCVDDQQRHHIELLISQAELE